MRSPFHVVIANVAPNQGELFRCNGVAFVLLPDCFEDVCGFFPISNCITRLLFGNHVRSGVVEAGEFDSHFARPDVQALADVDGRRCDFAFCQVEVLLLFDVVQFLQTSQQRDRQVIAILRQIQTEVELLRLPGPSAFLLNGDQCVDCFLESCRGKFQSL